MVEHATALVVMPGWQTSVGTKQEIALAKKRGLPTFYLKDEFDLEQLKAWYKNE